MYTIAKLPLSSPYFTHGTIEQTGIWLELDFHILILLFFPFSNSQL